VGRADVLTRLLGGPLARADVEVGVDVGVSPRREEEPARRQQAVRPSVAPTTQTTLVVGAGAALLPVGHHPGAGPGPVPGRGPSNAVVALVSCASALLLLVAFGAALHRASPPATTATAAVAAMEPRDDGAATGLKPQASGEPRHDGAASGPAPQADPPEATNTVASSIPQPIVTPVPEAPASSVAARPQSLPRTHRSGEKRLVLP
jgi:hypothetical protein